MLHFIVSILYLYIFKLFNKPHSMLNTGTRMLESCYLSMSRTIIKTKTESRRWFYGIFCSGFMNHPEATGFFVNGVLKSGFLTRTRVD